MARTRVPWLPEWEYEVTADHAGSVARRRYVTVAGHRPDTPAAVPLITAGGESLDEALANLREHARDWDAAAQLESGA